MIDDQVGVAIVGAGPYGLSLGAHLQARGIDYRVFGEPMHTWRTAMPRGMRLKSDGFASNLSDPRGVFTLAQYCAEKNIPYSDMGNPMVDVETFIDYGLEFKRRYVNNVDERWVTQVRHGPQGFSLELNDGTQINAQQLILAVGITYFSHMPEELRGLPQELCSHSSDHTQLDKFAGSHVAIIGGGSSALDLAALLHRAGVEVEVIARAGEVRFHSMMQVPRPLSDRIHAPSSGIGPGWRSRFYTDAAPVFHHLPENYRIDIVRNTLGPAGGWFIRDDVVGKVRITVGTSVIHAKQEGDHVLLELRGAGGTTDQITCDHIIAATGYRPDIARIEILEPELSAQIATVDRTPVLSAHFESSVPSLYLIGPIAANSFGPMLRFAYGSRFVARRLTRHLMKVRRR